MNKQEIATRVKRWIDTIKPALVFLAMYPYYTWVAILLLIFFLITLR